jgi:hypothetical protein
MQWPFQAWGATAALSGHEHTYERIIQNGFLYFVNGLGGDSRYSFSTPVSGSQVRYNVDYGAMMVDATDSQITFQFISRGGTVVDSYTVFASFPRVVNFQPTSSLLPSGYALGDTAAYGVHGDYGWR